MNRHLENRLLQLAGSFLSTYALILTLSPAVRERTWDVNYPWAHWIGLIAWALAFTWASRAFSQHVPDHDPYILPIAGLLSGWGLLTIWRLNQGFGLRQTIWISVTISLIVIILRLQPDLNVLRRYKYVLLTSGLILTSLTLLFGSNPAGTGPRLWLGCCSVYLQPSEPLKLLLVVYLAAYLADRVTAKNRLIPLLVPSSLVIGLALLLLIVQRDLGTASIFLLLYATMVYVAVGQKRILLTSLGALLITAVIGYFFVGLIHLRLDVWLNPWSDPSGNSYQIVQSLLAVANGGILGRGPGLGSPTLVPISHSDFIFSAITEESGLIGAFGLLCVLALLIGRGVLIALRAPDRFLRLLAAGLTIYFGFQSLLIIGGNLRVLPLTGVTLPFVSYGGSSLVTSFVAGYILLFISGKAEEEPAPIQRIQPYIILSGALGLGILAMSFATGWWTLIRGTDLLSRTDNARRSISDRYVLRGSLLDKNNNPINITVGKTGELERVYLVPDLAPVIGYTHPVYGQAGLESTLDSYLRGLQGNPASLIWWDRMLYGTPPPGLDVRLSLDLSLQAEADKLLSKYRGALIMLNANTGEILVLASHPGYDPTYLDSQGDLLSQNEEAPLLNRATLGLYEPDIAIEPFARAMLNRKFPVTTNERVHLYEKLGFTTQPQLRMPVAEPVINENTIHITPLQMVLASAAISNAGIRPAPKIAIAVNTHQQGWVILSPLGSAIEIMPPESAEGIARFLADNKPYWQFSNANDDNQLTWYLAGTLPEWRGTPLALVIVLENGNPGSAQSIGETLLNTALQR